MKTITWIAVLAVLPLLLCVAGILVATGDEPAEASCATVTASGQASIRRHVGAVGTWNSAAVDNAAIIVAVGQQKQIPARGWVIAVATAMTESRLINTSKVTDHDSVGLFQQRPSQGWGTPQQLIDPVYTSTKFYNALVKVKNWETLPLTVAAQKVQRSAFPDRYADFENDAEDVVAAVTGAASITDLPGASLADCGTPAAVSAGGWTQPVPDGIVSGFRTSERPTHQGVDLGSDRNDVIRAAAAGKVVYADCDGSTGNCNIDGNPDTTKGCGWFVEILHAGDVATRYCHMVRRPSVKYGQQVQAGDPIGLTGSSGHSSGPHLHYEVHLDVSCGKTRCQLRSYNATNPVDFMKKVGAPLGKSE
ncbi:M23 family metallopeptidase [Actinoplanes flavus]|uniref:M23 family metallopeptidase n=1 Tax=Actinoplanes flavus TaxID=2820290 RepID=A0ABS3UD24_9ACTN|nr:M23 family metallopeptidase [Actinoplanes flavus]MBO3736628.1 M23 family metallopeptidase [Actinoplanes flavus]